MPAAPPSCCAALADFAPIRTSSRCVEPLRKGAFAESEREGDRSLVGEIEPGDGGTSTLVSRVPAEGAKKERDIAHGRAYGFDFNDDGDDGMAKTPASLRRRGGGGGEDVREKSEGDAKDSEGGGGDTVAAGKERVAPRGTPQHAAAP